MDRKAQSTLGARNATAMLIARPPASAADGRMLTNQRTNQQTRRIAIYLGESNKMTLKNDLRFAFS